MSKGNMLLGHARGKVGSLVFSRLNGKQITRAKAEVVKNPKSHDQAVQRAIFATATVAASAMRGVIDHTFDGIKEGQANVQRFIKLNVDRLREQRAYNDTYPYLLAKGSKVIPANTYQVSEGNLGQIQPAAGNNPVLSLSSTDDGTAEGNDQVTVNDLKRTYPWFRNGCQLTFIYIQANKAVQGEQDPYDNTRVAFRRIVFSDDIENWAGPVIDDGGALVAGTYNKELTDIGIYNVETGDRENFATFGAKGSGALFINADDTDDDGVTWCNIGVAIIGTIYDETRTDPWVHTTSYMSIYDDYIVHDTQAAIATYQAAAVATKTSDYYADQAEYNDYPLNLTLEDAVSATVKGDGMNSKAVFIGKNNTYGPVPEGNTVYVTVGMTTGQLYPGSLKVLDGNNALAHRVLGTTNNMIVFSFNMPNATCNLNVTFEAALPNSESSYTAGIRTTISKVDS